MDSAQLKVPTAMSATSIGVRGVIANLSLSLNTDLSVSVSSTFWARTTGFNLSISSGAIPGMEGGGGTLFLCLFARFVFDLAALWGRGAEKKYKISSAHIDR